MANINTMKKLLFLLLFYLMSAPLKISAQSANLAQPVPLASVPKACRIKIDGNATGHCCDLKVKSAVVKVDTSIRVSPGTAYWSIEMEEITGTSLPEIANGTNSFWVTDKNGKEVKIKERFLKKIAATMENNLVNYTVKIPFRPKTDTKSAYIVRYRWESADRKKIIDIVSAK
jgi:hypothetical protein